MARSDRKRIAVVAAIALAVPAVIACNGIIGLDDYEKVECPGRRCADGGTTPDVFQPDVIADAPVEARGTDPVSWAQWPMPNYDGGTELLPNQPKYTVFDNDRIEDSVTKLVWRRATIGQASFDDAKAACTKLESNGPWRLPKRIELVSLLDFGRTGSQILIDPAFTGVGNVKVWTSSELRPLQATPSEQQYWTVDFGTGAVDTQPAAPNIQANVLCVRGK